MATHPFEAAQTEPYIDDSEYEQFDGILLEREVPGLDHAEMQRRMTDLLRPFEQQLGGRALQEWSISDGSGNWLTPDVTFSYPEIQITRRKHLLVPARLVVEIRSTDQTLKKLFDKRDRYRKWQIPHYWIIDPIETAAYDCPMDPASGSLIVVANDALEAGEIKVAVADILPESRC
jgi:Uma2 family endonuclease